MFNVHIFSEPQNIFYYNISYTICQVTYNLYKLIHIRIKTIVKSIGTKDLYCFLRILNPVSHFETTSLLWNKSVWYGFKQQVLAVYERQRPTQNDLVWVWNFRVILISDVEQHWFGLILFLYINDRYRFIIILIIISYLEWNQMNECSMKDNRVGWIKRHCDSITPRPHLTDDRSCANANS